LPLQFSLSNGWIIAAAHAVFVRQFLVARMNIDFKTSLAMNAAENEKATRQKVTFSFKGE